MKRIMLTVAYDGTDYNGWQWQPRGITIEEVLNRELSRLLKEEIHVQGASRTDAGVHALGNLCVFDTESRIPPEKICYALNQSLPEDIVAAASREVPPYFHPRKWDSEKTYEYTIDVSRFPNPLHRRYAYTTYYPLNTEAMRRAGAYLVGEHDFAAFCSSGSQVQTTVRRLLSLEVLETRGGGLVPCRPTRETGDDPLSPFGAAQKKGDGSLAPFGEVHDRSLLSGPESHSAEDSGVMTSGRIILRLRGNGFLYNMVRIIAGTLMEAGRGRMTPEDVKAALESKDRSRAGQTAPAEGLCLKEIRLLHPPWEQDKGTVPLSQSWDRGTVPLSSKGK